MSVQAGETVRIGYQYAITTTTDDGARRARIPAYGPPYLTRQARSRGFARIVFTGSGENFADPKDGEYESYARVKLSDLRAALDAITLEDEPVVEVKIYYADYSWALGRNQMQPFPKPLRFRLGNGGSRVRVTAPCGETRVYKLETLDRALTALGA